MPSKYNIKCITKGNYFDPNDFLEEIHVTSDGRVWPCCFYTSVWINPNETIKVDDVDVGLHYDEYIMKLFEDDPDWNNCNVKPIDEIIDHDFFMKHHSEKIGKVIHRHQCACHVVTIKLTMKIGKECYDSFTHISCTRKFIHCNICVSYPGAQL